MTMLLLTLALTAAMLQQASSFPDYQPEAGISTVGQTLVGFTFELHQNTTINPGQTIVMKTSITNIGDHYKPNIGVFVAPTAGTYVFQWSLHAPSGERAGAVLVARDPGEEVRRVKEGPLTYLVADDTMSSGTSSTMTVLECKADTTVWLETTDFQGDGTATKFIARHTSISGFQLNQDDSDDENITYSMGAVAFSADLSANYRVFHHQIIKFDNVMLNKGNAYFKDNGVFLCPDDAIYYFSWSTQSLADSRFVRSRLVMNGVEVRYGPRAQPTASTDSGTSTLSTILQCEPGAGIWVEAVETSSEHEMEYMAPYTSFTGFKLAAAQEITTEGDFRADPFVGFSVELSADTNIGHEQTIRFDRIRANYGGLYQPDSGVFFCVNEGIYIFEMSLGSYDVSTRVQSRLEIGGEKVKIGPYTSYIGGELPGTMNETYNIEIICQ